MKLAPSPAAWLVPALILISLTSCSIQTLEKGPASPYVATGQRPAGEPAWPLVGLGISGGGNRSALFASYVIELFGVLPVSAPTGTQPVSFLSTLGYFSSVSGGSFAASYFGMRNPSASPSGFNAMLAPGGVPEPYASFFSGYHLMMNHDWFSAAGSKWQIGSLSTWRAQSLVHALDGAFLDDATFNELDKRESIGRSPYLIFNSTHYDNGHRFVMTTIPRYEFCINVERVIQDVLSSSLHPNKSQVPLANLTWCNPDDPLTPEGFDMISDPTPSAPVTKNNPPAFAIVSQNIPLSYAVAMSGAFPVVVGPVAYDVKGHDGYFHMIDGGVADNSGIESITQLFLHKLSDDLDSGTYRHKDPQALIVELDAGKPFNAEAPEIKYTRTPVATLIHDPSRMSNIQEVRATLYRHDLWSFASEWAKGLAQKPNAPPTSQLVSRLRFLTLRHTDLDVSPLTIDVDHDPVAHGDSCHWTWNTAADVQQSMRNLPTDYNLRAACDVELTRIAACWSVQQNANAIQQWFTEHNGKPAPALDGFNAHVARLCPELKGRVKSPSAG